MEKHHKQAIDKFLEQYSKDETVLAILLNEAAIAEKRTSF